jgi:putative nucleotidyltransferase with HDIG domain
MVERLQRHGLATALIAKQLAYDLPFADDAFLAGMLHDIGKLVLTLGKPRSNPAGDGDTPESAIDQNTEHAAVGAYLLALWGLPFEVVEAVALHHTPIAPQQPPTLLDVVQIADAIAGGADRSDDRFAAVDPALLATLHEPARSCLTPDQTMEATDG